MDYCYARFMNEPCIANFQLINMELSVQAVFVEALGIVFVDAFDMAHQPLF